MTLLPPDLQALKDQGYDVCAPSTRPCEHCDTAYAGRPGQRWCSRDCAHTARDRARWATDPTYRAQIKARAERWFADPENRAAHNARTTLRRRTERDYAKEIESMPDPIKSAGKTTATTLAYLRSVGRPVSASEIEEHLPRRTWIRSIAKLVELGEIELRIAPRGTVWERTPAETVDVWARPSPTLAGSLPGGITAIHWLDGSPPEMRHVVHLHAALCSLLMQRGEVHDPSSRSFALLPAGTGSHGQWYVYWHSDTGCALAGSIQTLRLGQRYYRVRFGGLIRPKLPAPYAPGKYPIVLDAMTPVVIRAQAKKIHTAPVANAILVSLANEAERLLGLRVPLDDLALEITRTGTMRETIDHGGHIACPIEGLGRTTGWVGPVHARANASARWLLECAHRGMGLGSRRGYGMGRVEIRDVKVQRAEAAE